MARSMVPRVMLAVRALSTAERSRGLSAGSGPPSLAATVSSRMSVVKILPRLASCAALRCWMLAHLECPAMKTSVLVTSGMRCTPFAPGRCFYQKDTLRTGAVVLQERSVALAPCGSRDPAAERDFGRALHAVRTGTVLLQGGAVPGAK